MRSLVLLVVPALLATLAALQASGEEEDMRSEYCDLPRHSPMRRQCAMFKCSRDRARVVTIPCPESRCYSKLSYNEETFSKPYPECCAPAVC